MKTSVNKAKLSTDLSHGNPYSSSELGITMLCYVLLIFIPVPIAETHQNHLKLLYSVLSIV